MTIAANIFAAFILFFSFIGGLKDGAVKSFFSLISLLIAIPLSGIFYNLIARVLSFLPGENWENFVGFFITFGIISLTLFFVFFWPRTIPVIKICSN